MQNDTMKIDFPEEVTQCVAMPELCKAEVHCDLVNACLEPYADALTKVFHNSVTHEFYVSSQDLDAKIAGFKSELLKYLRYCVYARIQYVNGLSIYPRPKDRSWVVPAFLNAVLESIGEVTIKEYGIRVVPKLTEEQSMEFRKIVQDTEWIDGFQRVLEKYLDASKMTYAQGLPKSIEGSPELMTFEVIDQEVRNVNNRSNPVYALMAGFLHLKMLDTVILGRYVKYGEMRLVRDDVRRVVSYERRQSSRGDR